MCLVCALSPAAPAEPVSFRYDVLPVLAKQGCSMASCHGSPRGRGGFRLSIWGHDYRDDHATLTRDVFGRRVNVVSPESSLILLKPTTALAHEGGLRLPPDGPAYRVLRDWIAQGCRLDADAPACVGIDVTPAESQALTLPDAAAQLHVTARYADGRSRDATALAAFSSTDESVVTVSPTGVVTGRRRGEAAVNIRYLDHIQSRFFTFTQDVPGFKWEAPPPVNFIDELVDAKLKQLDIEPSPRCTDDEFIRRVHLDVVGILPGVERVRAFLADTSPDKRAKLIDELLARPEHAKFWAQRWADLLRVTKNLMGQEPALAYYGWIQKAVADDLPYDRFVQSLVTASGDTSANPLANFYLVGDDHYEVMEATAKLFLGVQIQCARCHNHPFERWTQDDYHGLRNFFYRVERESMKKGEATMIRLSDAGEVLHPNTGRPVEPWLPGAGRVTMSDSDDPRQRFADWLTGKDNHYFARVQVNRVWSWLLGRGLVEPADDFRDTNPPSNPALLDALAADFSAHGYSVRRVVRIILNSRTYQASVRPNDFNAGDHRLFSHFEPRRLTAEQLLDAVSHLTGVPESFRGVPEGTLATQLPVPDLSEHEFLKFFGQAPRGSTCACERPSESNLGEALQVYNGRLIDEKLRNGGNRFRRAIGDNKTDEQVIEELYLAAYCRPPRDAESTAARAYIDGKIDRQKAFEDLCWALMSTNEFFTQH